LTRVERLARWADVLEADPKRRLNTLGEIEFKSPSEQKIMRSDNSPLTVAFQDPVLRRAGLDSDRLGDAVEFFGLSDRQAHNLLCSCTNGMSMTASMTARRVRRMSTQSPKLQLAVWTAASILFVATPLVLRFVH
jgi:hypothetical protein